MEMMVPSLDSFHDLDLLLSPSAAKMAWKGQKWRFRGVPTTKTSRKSVSFGAATSGWFVLETIVEKNDSSHAAIHCLNLLISPSTVAAKIKGKCGLFEGGRWKRPRSVGPLEPRPLALV